MVVCWGRKVEPRAGLSPFRSTAAASAGYGLGRPWSLVFVLTRVAMAFLAGNPPIYTGSGLPITSDAYLYRDWGVQIVSLSRVPYLEIPIEYPPGLLPFILLPAWLPDAMRLPFLPSFVFLMVVWMVSDSSAFGGLATRGAQISSNVHG